MTTNFSPVKHGFQFQNDGFVNDVALNIRTQALCGGMSYAALDYYHAGLAVPELPYRPAPGTALRNHLYKRQVASITDNADHWGEFLAGAELRGGEFFNWGISAQHGIAQLRAFIDNGKPCVLGFWGGSGWGHQVVAIGYSMGAYKGDLGDHLEDFRIHVYDPNLKGVMTTIVADRARQRFCREDGSGDWKCYFVDTRYHPVPPPAVASPHYENDDKVHELVLECETAGEDLAGGQANLDLVATLTDGSSQSYANINLGARWVVGSTEFARVVLNRPMRRDQLRALMLSTPDNWALASLKVHSENPKAALLAQCKQKLFRPGERVLLVPVNLPRSLGLKVLVHLQGLGDQAYKADQYAGTRNQGRRLEGFQVDFDPPVAGLELTCMAHIQNMANSEWIQAGHYVGTRNLGLALEGFAFRLAGPLATQYDVEYMAHVGGIGDLPWARNGTFCGTQGQHRAVEGLQLRIVRRL